MLSTMRPSRAGIALLLVGVVFLFLGVRRHQGGGSAAFLPIGVALIIIGLRRMRRAPLSPLG